MFDIQVLVAAVVVSVFMIKLIELIKKTCKLISEVILTNSKLAFRLSYQSLLAQGMIFRAPVRTLHYAMIPICIFV